MAKQDHTKQIIFGVVGVAVLYAAFKGGEVIEKKEGDGTPAPLAKAYTPTSFIQKFFPINQEIEHRTGVPAIFGLAQGGLESLWGNKAPGNMFFGVKADKSWKGDTQLLPTWECGKWGVPEKDGIHDQIIAIYPPGDPKGNCSKAGLYSYRVYGKFRKYNTPDDSFLDHATFLQTMPRYKNAFNTSDPKLFAAAVADAGYSSSPAAYKILLGKIIDQVNTVLSKS